MTDRDSILRNADLALGDIDRVLAPTNTPIDDLVHHPNQAVVDITRKSWYQAWSQGERGPSGRLRYTDATAQRLADRDVRSTIERQARVRAALDAGDRMYCWRCCNVRVAARWSKVEGDDVCADCRRYINAWRSTEVDDDPYIEIVAERYERLMSGEHELHVDGVPALACNAMWGVATIKYGI